MIHTVLTIGLTPPSTPAKVGIFEWLVILMLRRFGVASEAVAVGFALTFHLVIVVPQVILGIVATGRIDWRRLLRPNGG